MKQLRHETMISGIVFSCNKYMFHVKRLEETLKTPPRSIYLIRKCSKIVSRGTYLPIYHRSSSRQVSSLRVKPLPGIDAK